MKKPAILLVALATALTLSVSVGAATSHARPATSGDHARASCPKGYYTPWTTYKTKSLSGNMIKKWQYRYHIQEPCSDQTQYRTITVYNYG